MFGRSGGVDGSPRCGRWQTSEMMNQPPISLTTSSSAPFYPSLQTRHKLCKTRTQIHRPSATCSVKLASLLSAWSTKTGPGLTVGALLILWPLSLVLLLPLMSQQCMCLAESLPRGSALVGAASNHRQHLFYQADIEPPSSFSPGHQQLYSSSPGASGHHGPSCFGGPQHSDFEASSKLEQLPLNLAANSGSHNEKANPAPTNPRRFRRASESLLQSQQSPSFRAGQTWSDKVTLPGDILLGGLFPIHMKGTKVECGQINRDRGIQRLEAMLYALDRINEDQQLLPKIKLGAILLDSCSSSTYALNQSLEFIRASINTVESSAFECKDKSAPRPKYGSKMIAGVVGGSYSEVSLQVANLLRLFRIPQVSYASTGTALSDKTLYDLFARTVPSDMYQARAIADIVMKLKWSYVSLVSSDGLYGDSGSREFMKQAYERKICIATHEKLSPTHDGGYYDAIVGNLLKKNATGVVLFTRAEDTRELLWAVKRANLSHNFAWVAADGWGTHQKLVEGVEEVAWGAITVELAAKVIPGFDSYMTALTPLTNLRNPWFSEYWQEWFGCQLRTDLLQQQQLAAGLYSSTDSRRATRQTSGGSFNNKSSSALDDEEPLPPLVEREAPISSLAQQQGEVARLMSQTCSAHLRLSESNGYRQEQKVQFVVDAVYAMAHALHLAWRDLCGARPGFVCEALKELNGGDFYLKYLLKVSFRDLAGSEVKFDERGDGLGRYNIYNFRHVDATQATVMKPSAPTAPFDTGNMAENSPALGATEVAGEWTDPDEPERARTLSSDFEYLSVGKWTENEYHLNLNGMQFLGGEATVPESFCAKPCELGQAKLMRTGDHCCWICKTCAPYEYLPDEFSCIDCGNGRWPLANKTGCFDLPQKHIRWDSVFSLISLSISCLGLGLTAFVTIIFIKYLDTPVVKASGRELSFILLAGMAVCHLATFVLLSKPTPFTCGGQRFLVNFGFALMYSSLLVKTNRISRIFNCARKSAKRPSFISPKSQMLITAILVAIQMFLTIVWFIFELPGIRSESPEGRRDEVILKCRAKGKSFILSLVYIMILITTCTIYAVKTRKIPENFNESKFIGFTMYTTIVIWLAFVTMFFGTNNSYEIQMNTMCVCISLSAHVTMFCLFSPKVSIILLHPDKNVRKLTMNSATYKRPIKPVSSFSALDGGRYNTTGTNQNNNSTDYPHHRNNSTTNNAGGSVHEATGGFSSQGGTGGGTSSTSNAPLHPDSHTANIRGLHDSSAPSNGPTQSGSGASNCSLSQRTPGESLLTCASCGAHVSVIGSSVAPTLAQSTASGLLLAGSSSARGIVGHEQPVTGKAGQMVGGGGQARLVHNRIAQSGTSMATGSSPGMARFGRHTDSSELVEQREAPKTLEALSGPAARHLQENTQTAALLKQTGGSFNFEGCESSSSLLANESEPIPTSSSHKMAVSKTATHKGVPLGKGSEPILWSQSVYSIDYCSDCCPSSGCCQMAHCSCGAYSSSNGLLQTSGSNQAAMTETGSRFTSEQVVALCDELGVDGRRSVLADWRRKSEEEALGGSIEHETTLRSNKQQQHQCRQHNNRHKQQRHHQTYEMQSVSGTGGAVGHTSRWGQHSSQEQAAILYQQSTMYALQSGSKLSLRGVPQMQGSENQQIQQTTTATTTISSNKDKSSEKGSASRQPAKLQASSGSSKPGPIQASLDLVKQSYVRAQAATEEVGVTTKRHRDKGCLYYHDDYEYSYGLVHSNSDTDNDYCFGIGDDTAETSSILREELDMYYGDDSSQKDASTAIQSTNLTSIISQQQQQADVQSQMMTPTSGPATTDETFGFPVSKRKQSHGHHHYHQHHKIEATSITDKRRRGSSKHGKSSTVGRRTVSRSQSGAGLILKEHRINSVAVIAATLSAGGAIVDSSGSSPGQGTVGTSTDRR